MNLVDYIYELLRTKASECELKWRENEDKSKVFILELFRILYFHLGLSFDWAFSYSICYHWSWTTITIDLKVKLLIPLATKMTLGKEIAKNKYGLKCQPYHCDDKSSSIWWKAGIIQGYLDWVKGTGTGRSSWEFKSPFLLLRLLLASPRSLCSFMGSFLSI